MAGSATNWFKPTSGPLKGQAIYLTRANQRVLAAGAKKGEGVLGRLERGDRLALTLARAGQKPAGIAFAPARPRPAPAPDTGDDDLFADTPAPSPRPAPAPTPTPASEADAGPSPAAREAAAFFENLPDSAPLSPSTPAPIVKRTGKPPKDMDDLFPEDSVQDVLGKAHEDYTRLIPPSQRARLPQARTPAGAKAAHAGAHAGFLRALRGVVALAKLAALPVTTSLAVVRATLDQIRPDTRRSLLLSAGAVVLTAATAGLAPPVLAVALLAADALPRSEGT